MWVAKRLHDFVDTIDSTDKMKRKKARTVDDHELDKAVFTYSPVTKPSYK